LADCAELAYADSYAAAACGDPTPLPDPPAPFPRSVETQLLTGVLHLAALEQLTLSQVADWFEAEDLTEVMDLIRRHYPVRPPQVLRWIPQAGGAEMFLEMRTAVDRLTAAAR
jgi:hypothetical protein